jgi:hypothetical protein
MGLLIQVLNASTSREINEAFTTFVRERPDAVFVGIDPFLISRRVQLAQLATFHKVPAAYALREFVEAGGLMSYGASLTDAFLDCCARTASGLATAAPPSSLINSRRFIQSPRRCHRLPKDSIPQKTAALRDFNPAYVGLGSKT